VSAPRAARLEAAVAGLVGDQLTTAEATALFALAAGASCRANAPIDCGGATLRGDFVRAVVVAASAADYADGAEPDGGEPFDLREIALENAVIEGVIDLSHLASSLPLTLRNCEIERLEAVGATLGALALHGCRFVPRASIQELSGNENATDGGVTPAAAAYWDALPDCALQLDGFSTEGHVLIDDGTFIVPLDADPARSDEFRTVAMRGARVRLLRVSGPQTGDSMRAPSDAWDGSLALAQARELLGGDERDRRADATVLAVLLYAAAVMDEPLLRVDRWLQNPDTLAESEITAILAWKDTAIGSVPASAIWAGVAAGAEWVEQAAATAETVENDLAMRARETPGTVTGEDALREARRLLHVPDEETTSLLALLLYAAAAMDEPKLRAQRWLECPTAGDGRKAVAELEVPAILDWKDTTFDGVSGRELWSRLAEDTDNLRLRSAVALERLLQRLAEQRLWAAPVLEAAHSEVTTAVTLDGVARAELRHAVLGLLEVTGLNGPIDLAHAAVAGGLTSAAVHVGRPGSAPLSMERATLGCLVLRACATVVRGEGSTDAIRATGAVISGDVDVGATVIGAATLASARIGGRVDLASSALFIGRGRHGAALSMVRAAIDGSFYCDATFFDGIVDLRWLEARGSVEFLPAARLLGVANSARLCLALDDARIDGVVALRGTFRGGAVVLRNAELGSLACGIDRRSNDNRRRGEFRPVNVEGWSLSCAGARIKGSVSLGGADFHGTVVFDRAHVQDDVRARGWIPVKALARTGHGPMVYEIEPSASFRLVEGPAFFAARPFAGERDPARSGGISLANAVVGGMLAWYPRALDPSAVVDLNGCRVATLDDRYQFERAGLGYVAETGEADEISGGAIVHSTAGDRPQFWKFGEGGLELRNFVYGDIDRVPTPEEGLDGWVHDRIEWIRASTAGGHYEGTRSFSPTPYDQLAAVLMARGHKEPAYLALRTRHDDERRYGRLGYTKRLESWTLGKLAGHGYQLGRTFSSYLFLVVIGTVVLSLAHSHALLLHRDGAGTFSAVGLSVDASIPFFSLGGYDNDWVASSAGWGWLVLAWLYAETLAGLALGFLVALGTSRRLHERRDTSD